VLAAGTVVQKEKGIQDSPEQWYQDVMRLSQNGVDPRMVRVIVDNSLEAFNFLYTAGLRWSNIDPLPGYTADRCYREANGGAKLTKAIAAEVKKRPGIKVMLDTKATRFIVDACGGPVPQGEVLGVECVNEDGKKLTIKARKGVGICTGDYSSNPAYIESHFPQLKGAKSVGHPGNTGDGIKMAQKVGADVTGLVPEGHPHCVETAPGKVVLWCRYDMLSRGGLILVNKDGKRFCDEVERGHYVPLLPEVQQLKDAFFAAVLDDATAKRIKEDKRFATNFRGNTEMFVKGLQGDGYLVKKGASLEELAQKLGVPAEGLKKTVAAYNEAAAKKTDAEFRRDGKYLLALDTPPFYGWKGALGIVETRGGLRIDPEARVLDVDFKPISRLYAAGHTTGGYTNDSGYRSGWNIMNALAFGRVMGNNIAASKRWA
jgi:fumarate reductase flavoprotein subunit